MPTLDQTVKYMNEKPAVLSHGKYTVALAPEEAVDIAGSNTSYRLWIYNNTDSNITVGPDNVSSYLISDTSRRPVKVLSPYELKADQERLADKKRAAVLSSGFSATHSAIRGGYQNSFAGQAMAFNNSANIARGAISSIDSNLEASRKQYEEEMLQNNSQIPPGGEISGLIVTDTRLVPSDFQGTFYIAVNLAGELHNFQINRAPHSTLN